MEEHETWRYRMVRLDPRRGCRKWNWTRQTWEIQRAATVLPATPIIIRVHAEPSGHSGPEMSLFGFAAGRWLSQEEIAALYQAQRQMFGVADDKPQPLEPLATPPWEKP